MAGLRTTWLVKIIFDIFGWFVHVTTKVGSKLVLSRATPKNRPEFTHQIKKISKSFQFGWGQSSLQSSKSGIRCTQVWQIHVTHLYSVGYNYVYVTCPPLEHYLTGPVQNCQDVLGRAFNSCWDLWFIFGQISSNFLDLRRRQHEIPSGYVKIAIANGPFIVDFPIKNGMEIFHSYCMWQFARGYVFFSWNQPSDSVRSFWVAEWLVQLCQSGWVARFLVPHCSSILLFWAFLS